MAIQKEPGQKGVNWSNIAVGRSHDSSPHVNTILTIHVGGIMNMVQFFGVFISQNVLLTSCYRDLIGCSVRKWSRFIASVYELLTFHSQEASWLSRIDSQSRTDVDLLRLRRWVSPWKS